MLERWNAHDLEGHLDVYRKSPESPVVVGSEQFKPGSNFTILTLAGIQVQDRLLNSAGCLSRLLDSLPTLQPIPVARQKGQSESPVV